MKKVEEQKSQDCVPDFRTEQEEASWWDAHPEALAARFQDAKQEGRLHRLSQTNLPGALETVTIHMPEHELSRARQLAAKRGLRYQTYLEILLHEALDGAEKQNAEQKLDTV